jgi:hypothetical protein
VSALQSFPTEASSARSIISRRVAWIFSTPSGSVLFVRVPSGSSNS